MNQGPQMRIIVSIQDTFFSLDGIFFSRVSTRMTNFEAKYYGFVRVLFCVGLNDDIATSPVCWMGLLLFPFHFVVIKSSDLVLNQMSLRQCSSNQLRRLFPTLTITYPMIDRKWF